MTKALGRNGHQVEPQLPASTADMRRFLLEQMIGVAQGTVDVGQAKAMCNFAQQVYNTVKLEMQFASLKMNDTALEPIAWNTSSAPVTKSLRAA